MKPPEESEATAASREGGGGSPPLPPPTRRLAPAETRSAYGTAFRLAPFIALLLQPLGRWLKSDRGRWAHDCREWFGIPYIATRYGPSLLPQLVENRRPSVNRP